MSNRPDWNKNPSGGVTGPGHIGKHWPKPNRPPTSPMPDEPRSNPPLRRRQPRGRSGVPQLMFNKAPIAINTLVSGNRARVKNGKTIVHHRELIGTIQATGATFTLNNGTGEIYPINPTDPGTFKWLSTMASNYDTYNLLSCCLEYVPMCSTTEIGRVALFYDRDSQDTGPFDRNELANYAVLAESSPWSPMTLTLPDLRGERFLQDAITNDARLSDAGRVGWCTYGNTGTNLLGDVFICYEVELLNPQPSTSGTHTSRLQPLAGVLVNYGPRYVLGASFTQAAVSTHAMRLQTGTYFVTGFFESTTGGITAIAPSITGDASFVNGDTRVSNANRASASLVITVRDTKATLTFSITGGTITTVLTATSRASVPNQWL